MIQLPIHKDIPEWISHFEQIGLINDSLKNN